MPVELIFNAPSVDELHAQITRYAQALQPAWLLTPDPRNASPLAETDPVANMVGNANKAHDVVVNERKKPTKEETANAKKSKANAKKSEATPEPEPQPEPLGEPQGDEPFEVEIDEPGLNATPTSALDTISAEKLKAEVIAKMQDWFAAGKVKLIRGVLEQYGDGAKSFPEIPAERFVKIDQAIKSGEIA